MDPPVLDATLPVEMRTRIRFCKNVFQLMIPIIMNLAPGDLDYARDKMQRPTYNYSSLFSSKPLRGLTLLRSACSVLHAVVSSDRNEKVIKGLIKNKAKFNGLIDFRTSIVDSSVHTWACGMNCYMCGTFKATLGDVNSVVLTATCFHVNHHRMLDRADKWSILRSIILSLVPANLKTYQKDANSFKTNRAACPLVANRWLELCKLVVPVEDDEMSTDSCSDQAICYVPINLPTPKRKRLDSPPPTQKVVTLDLTQEKEPQAGGSKGKKTEGQQVKGTLKKQKNDHVLESANTNTVVAVVPPKPATVTPQDAVVAMLLAITERMEQLERGTGATLTTPGTSVSTIPPDDHGYLDEGNVFYWGQPVEPKKK